MVTDIRPWVYAHRGWLPLPLLVMMAAGARPSVDAVLSGGVLVCVGEVIRLWGVRALGPRGRSRTLRADTRLVTGGPFAHVRNPIYIANVMMYAGFGLASRAFLPWLPLVASVWFVAQYGMIISLEEEHLQGCCGAAYDHYRASVRRVIPRLAPYREGQNQPPWTSLPDALVSERRTFQAIAVVSMVLAAIGWLRSA